MTDRRTKKVLVLSFACLVLVICCATFVIYLAQPNPSIFAESHRFKVEEMEADVQEEPYINSNSPEVRSFELEVYDEQGEIVFDYSVGGGPPGTCMVFAKGVIDSINLEEGVISLLLTQEQVVEKVSSSEISLLCSGIYYDNGEIDLASFSVGDNVVAEFGWPQDEGVPRCGFLRKL